MSRIGFCGPTYTSQSPNVDAERCVNMILEQVEAEGGKSRFALYQRPGMVALNYLKSVAPFPALYPALTNGTVTDSNVSVMFALDGTLFAVGPKNFARINSDLTADIVGYASAGGTTTLPRSVAIGPASKTDATLFNVLIVGDGTAYAINANAINPPTTAARNVTTSLVDTPFQCAYIGGYYVVLFQNSQKFQISAPLDALTWDALDVAVIQKFPDNAVGMFVDHDQLIFFGKKQSIVYQNTGNPDFPFEPVPGGFAEVGMAAAFSAAKLDNRVFWLGLDERGAGMVFASQGYLPVRVSTHAVENAFAGYSTIEDAQASTMQYKGHSLYILYFPTADKTWVYDAATQQWTEWEYLDPDTGLTHAHMVISHAYAYGAHFGGGRDGAIYAISDKLLMDCVVPPTLPNSVRAASRAIRRVRRTPFVALETERIEHHELELDCELGLNPGSDYLTGLESFGSAILPSANSDGSGLAAGDFPTLYKLLDGAGNVREAQMTLRWSDDGGHTWSNEYTINVGKSGEYTKRAVWRRLGTSKHRGRIYEWAMTDPVPTRITDAFLKTNIDSSPKQRLANQALQSA